MTRSAGLLLVAVALPACSATAPPPPLPPLRPATGLLLMRAVESIRIHDWPRARAVLDRVALIDPDAPEAARLRAFLEDGERIEARVLIHRCDPDWPAPWTRLVVDRLDELTRYRVTVSFPETPLSEVVEHLSAYARVEVHDEVHPRGPCVRLALRDVRLDEVLRLIAEQVGARLSVRDGAIWLEARREAPYALQEDLLELCGE